MLSACMDIHFIIVIMQKITRIKPENKEDKWPKMRLGHHAACCLDFNTKSPQLLISGGRIKHKLPPKDIWILNLSTQEWKQVCTQHTKYMYPTCSVLVHDHNHTKCKILYCRQA